MRVCRTLIVSLLSLEHPLKLAMIVGGHHPDGSMGDGRRLSMEKATLLGVRLEVDKLIGQFYRMWNSVEVSWNGLADSGTFFNRKRW